MSYKVRIELFKAFEIDFLDFESSSAVHVLNSFDQIDWSQQVKYGVMEENNGEFPFFEVEHIQSGRKIGGLFVVYNTTEYNFNAHAEIYQKQFKSHLFGLFKTEALPSFDNEDVPFNIFRNTLELFLQSHDTEIERLFSIEYPHYGFRRST